MDQMEDKLNSILGNPQMMQQIMSMAQALGAGSPEPPKEDLPPPPPAPSVPGGLDLGTIQKLIGIARQSGIDNNQQALLKALAPYLSQARIVKLEKAMRAAKIASLASTALGSEGTPFFSSR